MNIKNLTWITGWYRTQVEVDKSHVYNNENSPREECFVIETIIVTYVKKTNSHNACFDIHYILIGNT